MYFLNTLKLKRGYRKKNQAEIRGKILLLKFSLVVFEQW